MKDRKDDTLLRQQLREMGQHLIALADSALGDLGNVDSPGIPMSLEKGGGIDYDDLPRLKQIALLEYKRRERRKKYFYSELFGEPAWDMLLELFVAKADGIRVSATSICIASQAPMTTALRWLEILGSRGLIVKQADMLDGRRTLIELSDDGFRIMQSHLRDCDQDNPLRSKSAQWRPYRQRAEGL